MLLEYLPNGTQKLKNREGDTWAKTLLGQIRVKMI